MQDLLFKDIHCMTEPNPVTIADDATKKILTAFKKLKAKKRKRNMARRDEYDDSMGIDDKDTPPPTYCQWGTSDNRIFVPSSKTVKKLIPGVYEIDQNTQFGTYFEKIPVKTEGLLRFPDTNSDKVVNEIQKFWDREDVFRHYDIAYKRGIILYGPPGSGKSCTVQLIMQDVVQRKGIVLEFNNPYLFIDGMRILRQIQPETPVVVIMEDIDSILQSYNESEILNILDGVNQMDRVVFLATTNYPQELGHRIMNRPSRFDKRFRIGFPSAASRKIYFEHLIGKENFSKLKIDIKKWVIDTDEFSIAHLKELFVAVVILQDNYDEALKTLRDMKEQVNDKDYEADMGFCPSEKSEDYYS